MNGLENWVALWKKLDQWLCTTVQIDSFTAHSHFFLAWLLVPLEAEKPKITGYGTQQLRAQIVEPCQPGYKF